MAVGAVSEERPLTRGAGRWSLDVVFLAIRLDIDGSRVGGRRGGDPVLSYKRFAVDNDVAANVVDAANVAVLVKVDGVLDEDDVVRVICFHVCGTSCTELSEMLYEEVETTTHRPRALCGLTFRVCWAYIFQDTHHSYSVSSFNKLRMPVNVRVHVVHDLGEQPVTIVLLPPSASPVNITYSHSLRTTDASAQSRAQ
ncbi:hypothetical protein DENSPDRAFT_855754, partial [Dentipellis sp. KUC8613]